ncbi:MAG: hypothetical protein MZU84_05165 [Sphingobacterium sp.]|nr:hypothetical protein [Sphingobacterium sp.]
MPAVDGKYVYSCGHNGDLLLHRYQYPQACLEYQHLDEDSAGSNFRSGQLPSVRSSTATW